jgi:hypothetical protein
MDIIKKHPRAARTMGIMTGATPALFYRIILVLPLERRLVGLVAPQTKRGILVLQELRILSRDVRIVALEAVFRHRLMLKLICQYPASQFLVAFKAELAASPYQNHLVISGVWIMA